MNPFERVKRVAQLRSFSLKLQMRLYSLKSQRVNDPITTLLSIF